MLSFIIPSWPKYDDYRCLKPSQDPAELTKLCQTILDKHGATVDLLHPDVRKMLAVGHVHGRRWACDQVRRYLATNGRDLLLKDYFEKLEAARQAAVELPFYEYLPADVKLALETEVAADMPHDLRIQLRNALVKVQEWEREAENYHQPRGATSSGRSRSTVRKRAKSERDKGIRSRMNGLTVGHGRR